MTNRVPRPSQVVYLDAAASPQFRDRPIHLLLTTPVQVLSVDAAQRHPVETATWWLLTGWQLDGRGQRLLHRTASVRAAGTQIVHHSVVA